MIGRVSSEWRKEPGDFIYDAVAPSAEEVKGLEINLDYALKNGFGQYAEGVYMDALLAELGLERNPATSNKRALSIQAVAGVVIDKGHTLVTVVLDKDGNQIEFTVDDAHTYAVNGTATINITSKTKGAISNVPNGSEFTFTPTIPGIVSITDSGTTYPGVDAEGDESCWDRYQFKVNNIETGGNKNDYVRWAK
jgi:uncharacterized phage protein gp47/JayE